ncbi:hypothetical protein SLS64_000250 [Diaporthe eres]
MHRIITTFVAYAAYVACTPLEKATRDYSAGCSETSFGDFEWTVQDFDYHASYIFTTPAHQNSWGYVNFNLSNPAVPDLLASCSAASSQLSDFFYGTMQYNCTFDGQVGQPGPAPAKFTFNRPSGEVVVDQKWVCRDQDPQYPKYRIDVMGSQEPVDALQAE